MVKQWVLLQANHMYYILLNKNAARVIIHMTSKILRGLTTFKFGPLEMS